MKRLTNVLVLTFLLFYASFSYAASIVIHIKGLKCPFCFNVLTTNLKKISGVEDAEMSPDNDSIQLTYKLNKKPNVQAINQTIVNSGFTPTQIESKNITPHMDVKNQECSSCHKS